MRLAALLGALRDERGGTYGFWDMMAGLDEATVVTLVAVLAGGGLLALAAAWMLWRRERAATDAVASPPATRVTPAAAAQAAAPPPHLADDPRHGAPDVPRVVLFTPSAAATVAPAANTPAVEERIAKPQVTSPGVTPPSGGGLSRVELFRPPVSSPEHPSAAAVAEKGVTVEAAVARNGPSAAPVESEIFVADRAVPVLEVPATAAPVRRRPKPAWELAEDGQTPDGLLARAHELLAASSPDEAAVQLRACARLASRLKVPAIEAVARMELGDLCQASGDMTTACEHWQMARSLYAELKQAAEAAVAVKRMEKAGCPTDWVLTKF